MSLDDAPTPRTHTLMVDDTEWTIARQDEPGAAAGLWLRSSGGEALFYATSASEAPTADEPESVTIEQAVVMIQVARTRAGRG